jgi:hypothetical protein
MLDARGSSSATLGFLLKRIMFETPFRWDLTHRTHLGNLVEGERAASYDAFLDHLLPCCSRLLAFAGNSDLIFVGRSPESIFDHLSGLLFDSLWFDRLELLHFSMRFSEESEIRKEHPDAVEAMRSYLQQLGLHPEGLATRRRPAAFIDLVATGDTFGRLTTFLHNWARDIKYDWKAVKRRIRLVGITEKTKTSPRTWRWQQHAHWLPLLDRGAVKNVSVPRDLWEYLGNYQDKVSQSYTPSRWGDPALSSPSHEDQHLKALRLAFELFELGRKKEQREQFASLLVREPAMKYGWFRMLAQEIRS